MLSYPVARICPGKELADSNLFIAIAMLVAAAKGDGEILKNLPA